MAYTYIAYAQFRDPALNKWADPSVAPVVSAIDGSDGSAIAGATITKIAVGIYRCELLNHSTKRDVIFKVHTDDDTYPDFALLESERTFDIIDWMSTLPANFWGYATRTLTQTLTQVKETIKNSSITAYRGNTWALGVVLNTDLTGYTNLQFSIKTNEGDTDAESLVFIDNTGLVYINGAAAATPANGSLVINDALTGDITINLASVETAKLSIGRKKYGIQAVVGGVTSEISIGTFVIYADVVRADA